jgi:catalase
MLTWPFARPSQILDATKLWPEELVPLKKIGTMQLNRTVDDYFAEVEQVAFCTQHIVPGIDFSNDPLLQGRNFSYFDTQISRIGVNFHDLPINRPVCPVYNNLRDGKMARKINRGKVNYSPNRFETPKVSTAEEGGFVPYPVRAPPPCDLPATPPIAAGADLTLLSAHC